MLRFIMDDMRSSNIEGVRRFLNSNPLQADIKKMIYVAAMNDHTACEKIMLPHSLVPGSQMKHNDALRAANNGHVECGIVDPRVQPSLAQQRFVWGGGSASSKLY